MPLQNKNSFFLTRQIANIMEDLSRRLQQAGSISLLYGPEGIGKSRLLSKFVETRLTPENSIFVQFNVNNTFVEVIKGEDEFEYDTFFTRQISRLSNNFTLVIDQFDNAPADIQLSILKFWNKIARQKNFKLIISIQSNGLHQLTELSQRYHLQIDSVELKPLNRDEQLEYLRFTSCTALRQVAVVPPALKKPLKLTNGIFSRLETFRTRFDEQILCKEIPLNFRSKLKKGLLYSISGLLLISLPVIIIQQQVLKNDLLILQSPVPVFKSRPIKESEHKVEPERLIASDAESTLVDTVEELPLQVNSSIEPLKQPVEPDATNQSTPLENMQSSIEPKAVVDEPETVTAEPEIVIPEPETVIAEPEIAVFKSEQVIVEPEQSILHQRILATKKWLESADNSQASIQIMTLTIGDNPLLSLNRYLNKLKSKQINLDEIKVFSLIKGDQKIYGVLYGEYESINLAYREIENLPDALNANQPILRTVKGIKDEIDGR